MRPRLLVIVGIICLAASAASAATLSFPPLTGRVVDGAHILTPQTQAQLTTQLEAFEQASHIQLVVVTLAASPAVAIEDYGYQLGRAWGIGQRGKNTGALFIVDPTGHQTRIEVGYGLEGDLTDVKSKMIIEQVIIPYFKQGDYNTGIIAGTAAIISTLGGQADIVPAPAPVQQGFPLGGFVIIFLLFLFLRRFGRGRRSGFLTPLVLGSMLGNSRSSGSGWGGGGGFSGGGGSFGGGGASGRW
jgi:uncharacterized protein